MKVVGIDITGGDVNWIGLEGTQARGQVFLMTKNKLPFPTSHDTDYRNLVALKALIGLSLQSAGAEKVAIVRAGKDCSPLRIKCEFVVELACDELNIPCNLVAPQTIAAAQKRKVPLVTGSSLATAFNSGAAISPQYLEKAAYCAWTALPGGAPC
ncbi:MAG TPA: hypothetical protein P5555_05545 [Candidatus Paceibacterota bacterium]|nr:hypothetical protein [Verrucomicrobiota bacterium]HRZ44634.1 hypothetical protein [Candidatus Paceibacterota bacterium]